MTLTEYEFKKMICSGDLGFYEKRSLPPISVTNKRFRRTEIEKMSNFRNLFCMVAIDIAGHKANDIFSWISLSGTIDHWIDLVE